MRELPPVQGDVIAEIYDEIAASKSRGHLRDQLISHGMLEWMLTVAGAGARRSGKPFDCARSAASLGACNNEDIVVLTANLIEGVRNGKHNPQDNAEPPQAQGGPLYPPVYDAAGP